MGRVSTYVNFAGTTEEAFRYYETVFATTITSLTRFSDMPFIPVAADEATLVMNVQLPIHAGHLLMGSDMLASLGHTIQVGNNTTIVLETESREQADAYYQALQAGGDEQQCQPMGDMPWGAYWGVCLDRFQIRWMISYTTVA